MNPARTVALEAIRVLHERGVHDVAGRLSIDLLPEEKPDAAASEVAVARGAVAALKERGLTAIAANLERQLVAPAVVVPAPAPAAPDAP